jgi:adenosine deaminase/adenosine deaminase CECR1
MKNLLTACFVLTTVLSHTQTINDYFQKVRNNQAELTAFISQMPKGGDLHHHYSGALYAETYFTRAVENDFWLNTETLQVSTDAKTDRGWTKFSALNKEGKLNVYREKLLQLWSMKNYNGSDGEQHFFAAFGLLSPLSNIDYVQGLNELKERAVAENISYLEVMFSRVDLSNQNIDSTNEYNTLLKNLQAQKDSVGLNEVLNRLYSKIMQLAVEDSVKSFTHFLDSLHYTSHIDDANFTMRYQTYIVRVQNAVTTFKNLIASFEAAKKDSLIVGVNIVAPEDDPVSMRDYWLHMRMFAYCHQKYPSVKYSMHAGEITEGYVQPEALTNHIFEAVYVAGAQRIGHGVDIAYEKNNYQLLNYMSRSHIAVEINLSSNEYILGIKNDAHPLMLYYRFHVPVVISTDDAGVNRSSLTEQYILLASRYKNISYSDIKKFVYNSITYSFLNAQKKEALKKDLDERFKKFERYVLTNQPSH